VTHAQGRALVYAGLNDNCLADTVEAANEYFQAGIDAVVALSPSYFPLQPPELLGYFQELLERLQGPVVLYNIPSTTHLSIPIRVLEQLVGHPRLAGVKDSENNAARLEELLRTLGGRTDFSIFIGVGALMARMLLLGADGIVPSVGNLVPDLCHELFVSAGAGVQSKVEQLEKRMMEAAMLYQRGRTLGQSLAALKAAMSLKGLCGPAVLSPLRTLDEEERESIRQEMLRLGLLAAPVPLVPAMPAENPSGNDA
jgi:4-hydroxy-tetrahydrodipicolinate synthase